MAWDHGHKTLLLGDPDGDRWWQPWELALGGRGAPARPLPCCAAWLPTPLPVACGPSASCPQPGSLSGWKSGAIPGQGWTGRSPGHQNSIQPVSSEPPASEGDAAEAMTATVST